MDAIAVEASLAAITLAMTINHQFHSMDRRLSHAVLGVTILGMLVRVVF